MTLATVQAAAEALVENITGNSVLSIASHASNRAFIVRFETDKGLRCFGQTLIRHNGGSVGLVFLPDGRIPREIEARDILNLEGQFPAAGREGLSHTDRLIARISGALALCYADEADVPAHLITHALSDLRHLCDQYGLDFAALDQNAYSVYRNGRAQI